jgi:hypothetical protein
VKRLLIISFLGLSALIWIPQMRASLIMPLPDIYPPLTDRYTSAAIWSSTNVSLPAGTVLRFIFPTSHTIRNINLLSCECVFIKYSACSGTACNKPGKFSANEVLIWGGSVNAAKGIADLVLPEQIGPGRFYIRFDNVSSFLKTPATPGAATIQMVSPQGVTINSFVHYISETHTAAVDPAGRIYGNIYGTDSSVNVAGAMIFAYTNGLEKHPHPAGPKDGYFGPLPVTAHTNTTISKSDGTYTLSVPPGQYTIQATFDGYFYSYVSKTSIRRTLTSTAITVSITQGSQALTNFNLPGF